MRDSQRNSHRESLKEQNIIENKKSIYSQFTTKIVGANTESKTKILKTNNNN